jgi:hypothetical protein
MTRSHAPASFGKLLAPAYAVDPPVRAAAIAARRTPGPMWGPIA